jgi:transposase-like protein
MITCPHCHQTTLQVKVGRTPSGSQRYLCRYCHRKYTPDPKDPGYPESLRRQALQLYVDGMNLRRIARQLGIVHQTVANWVKAHADTLPDLPPQPEATTIVEQDELYTFVKTKKTPPMS